jgi:cytochrome c
MRHLDVVGRPAGRVAGFHYSPANRDSGLTWDTATLDRYLTSPATVVPHTIMTYAGLKDATKRADLTAYLATLR